MNTTTDILDVAAVVLGEQRIRLTGWQCDHAIAAMTALGYSCRHIAYSTKRREDGIRRRAAQLGIRLNRNDMRPDWFAIDMVTSGSACIHLLNIDRLEAIRIMAARGLDSAEMARRLRCDPHNVCMLASRIGVRITRGTWGRGRRPNAARRHQREQVAA